MLFKVFGAILILTSSTLTGICYKRKYSIYIRELENFSSCLDVLSNEISLSLKNLYDSLSNTNNYASEFNHIFFDDLLRMLQNSDGETISYIWCRCLDENITFKLIYAKDDINDFKEFGNLLSSGDTQIHLKNIKNLKIKLENKVNTLKLKKEKVSVIGKLGVYFGAAIVIMLI